MRTVKPGMLFRHFKNKLYQIAAVAEHSETGEMLVIYQALYGTYRVYARPLEMFLSEVDHEKYPQVTQKYRFEPADQLVNLDVQVSEIMQKKSRETSERPRDSESVETSDTPVLDPLLEAFLDADSYRERLNILRGLEHRITQEMINTMAIVLDLDIPDGDLEKRYQDLENSILTLDKYECTRLREESFTL